MNINVEKPKKAVRMAESELRQDIITGDWVVIATGRAKRPDDFTKTPRAVDNPDVADPFLDLSDQEEPVLIYRMPDGDWSLAVIPNKYPAFARSRPARELSTGPFFAMTGVGYHEVIITRDPVRTIADFEPWRVTEVIDAYQERYLALMNKNVVNSIHIFHNYGKEAGASIAHPHSQLMAIPVVSPQLEAEIRGAELYYRNNRRNVYDVIIEYESEDGTRVVYENKSFIVLCPFASSGAFEMRIYPKRSSAYFERITEDEKILLGDALQKALLSIKRGLADPAYNFCVHTAPCNGKDYPHFRWHIGILPKTSVWAGFELATGIEVSSIQPEVAANFLREKLS